MNPSTTTGHAVVPQQRRERSMSVDDVGDFSHGNDNHVNDSVVIMNQNTSNSNSLVATDDGVNVNTTAITRPTRATRRKFKDQKSVASTSNSNHTDNQSHTNIDPLMGSMEFDESQASVLIDENGFLPGVNEDDAHNGGRPHASNASSSSMDDSSSSSSSSNQSSEYSNSMEKRRARSKKNELTVGQKETMALRRTRSTLFALVIVIAIMGAIIISAITVQKELETFEHDFQLIGDGIVDHLEQHLHLQLQSLDTLANDVITLTNQEEFNTLGWPFITIPSSSSILERYMALLHTSLVCMYPIVHASQRTQWEQYSTSAQGWV